MKRTTYYWQDNCEIWECQYLWIDEGDGHLNDYKIPFTDKLFKSFETKEEAERFLKKIKVDL